MGAARPSFYLVRMISKGIIYLTFFLSLPPMRVSAQSEFPENTRGGIVYSRMVPFDSLLLPERTVNARKLYDYIQDTGDPFNGSDEFNTLSGEFVKAIGFTIYNKGLVTKNPAGYAVGKVILKISGDGYNLSISDIKYAGLKRNRYAQYRPGPAGYVALEKSVKQHSGKTWKSAFRRLDDRITMFLDSAEHILVSGHRK